MNAMLASASAERQIEEDIKEVEDHCSKINCSEIRKSIYSIINLIKDFVSYITFCKGKKD